MRAAWRGEFGFAASYRSVSTEDVPFAQDALGDQYLLREGEVWRLNAECDQVEPWADSLGVFIERVCAAPFEYLELGPFVAFRKEGGTLAPGQLMSVYPPLMMRPEQGGRSYRAISAADRLDYLASLATQIRGMPDGTGVEIKVT